MNVLLDKEGLRSRERLNGERILAADGREERRSLILIEVDGTNEASAVFVQRCRALRGEESLEEGINARADEDERSSRLTLRGDIKSPCIRLDER